MQLRERFEGCYPKRTVTFLRASSSINELSCESVFKK
jgi:hypothetical protein